MSQIRVHLQGLANSLSDSGFAVRSAAENNKTFEVAAALANVITEGAKIACILRDIDPAAFEQLQSAQAVALASFTIPAKDAPKAAKKGEVGTAPPPRVR
jgi:hypothetical protein